LPPATIENGAGRSRCGVVRGCPLRTGRDRCEWHGSGTPDEDDVRRARKSRHQLDRRVRPNPGDTRLVGKGRRRPAAAGRWDSNPAPGCFAGRGRSGGRPVTCGSQSPTVTAGDHRRPAVLDAVRTQRGPRIRSDPVTAASGATQSGAGSPAEEGRRRTSNSCCGYAPNFLITLLTASRIFEFGFP
jgi:hypothetical protein